MFGPRARQEGLGLLAAVLVSFLACVVLTWPMIEYSDVIVLGGGELGGWLWRYDWHFRSLDGLFASDAGFWDLWKGFVGLGRYPETGNILDVLAISYPLEHLLGFPASYNFKIVLILSMNGLCGYALGRYFSGSIAGALGACAIAVVNPLTIYEVQSCGLRQALLWWVLLYPPLIDRALRRRTLPAGILAGVCFGMASAFYWFYGLFTFIFTLAWLVKHATSERVKGYLPGLVRALVGLGIGIAITAGPFVLPYALSDAGGSSSASSRLPEMSFFLPFPAYDTISHAPLRPQTYGENVLASIHRTIGSSWTMMYPVDPTLNEALPLTVLLFGILPALWRRKTWGWLAIWSFFYLGTLGPFLRIGSGDAQNVIRVMDDYVVRLPYTLMFQFIPGMSRMFAPYRLGSFVVVCSVALVAIGLSRFRQRSWLAGVVLVLTVLQPMLRLGRGAVNEGDADSRDLRSPIKANRIKVPLYYQNLDRSELGGIIEVPTDQQQDLLYYYQITHGQKVYHSWASPAAVPPLLRPDGAGGDDGARLRFQARADAITGVVPDAIDALSHAPDTGDLTVLGTPALQEWAQTNQYKRLIIHERGYYLVDPSRGRDLYLAAVSKVSALFGQEAVELDELRKGDPLNPQVGVPIVGDLVPWSSQPTDLPPQKAPSIYHMAVFLVPGMEGVETEANVALGEQAKAETARRAAEQAAMEAAGGNAPASTAGPGDAAPSGTPPADGTAPADGTPSDGAPANGAASNGQGSPMGAPPPSVPPPPGVAPPPTDDPNAGSFPSQPRPGGE